MTRTKVLSNEETAAAANPRPSLRQVSAVRVVRLCSKPELDNDAVANIRRYADITMSHLVKRSDPLSLRLLELPRGPPLQVRLRRQLPPDHPRSLPHGGVVSPPENQAPGDRCDSLSATASVMLEAGLRVLCQLPFC